MISKYFTYFRYSQTHVRTEKKQWTKRAQCLKFTLVRWQNVIWSSVFQQCQSAPRAPTTHGSPSVVWKWKIEIFLTENQFYPFSHVFSGVLFGENGSLSFYKMGTTIMFYPLEEHFGDMTWKSVADTFSFSSYTSFQRRLTSEMSQESSLFRLQPSNRRRRKSALFSQDKHANFHGFSLQ